MLIGESKKLSIFLSLYSLVETNFSLQVTVWDIDNAHLVSITMFMGFLLGDRWTRFIFFTHFFTTHLFLQCLQFGVIRILVKLLSKFVRDLLLNCQIQQLRSMLNMAGHLFRFETLSFLLSWLSVLSLAPCECLFFAFLRMPKIPKISFLLELSSELQIQFFVPSDTFACRCIHLSPTITANLACRLTVFFCSPNMFFLKYFLIFLL